MALKGVGSCVSLDLTVKFAIISKAKNKNAMARIVQEKPILGINSAAIVLPQN